MADRFCTECGAGLGLNDKFCPACGAMVREDDSVTGMSASDGRPYNTYGNVGLDDKTKFISILVLVWGAFALITALGTLLALDVLVDAMVDALKNTVYEDRTMWDYFLENGLDRSVLESMFLAVGIVYLVSGLSALFSAHMIYRKQHYMLSLILLLVCVLTSVAGLLTFFIGIYMLYKLSTQKIFFTS